MNSIDWNDKIFVVENEIPIITEIGAYIDEKIKTSANVRNFDNNGENEMGNTYYVDTLNENIKTISVGKTGKLSWNKVTALTKHLPINIDGSDDLVKIKTITGKEVTATKAKSFLTQINGEIVPIRGDEIYVGMQVPITNKKYNANDVLENIEYDEIISIEIVKPSKEYVYDLTVENDKTFMAANGLFCMDTFHSAGVGSATSLGVPRVKELMSLSRNIKTPVMSIILTDEHRSDSEIANRVSSYLKHTTIDSIRKEIEIYYDPMPLTKGGFMDRDHVHNAFYSHTPSKNSCQSDITSLPWLIRIKFDREKLMEKNITLLDIKSKFCNNWERRYNDVKGLKKEERVLLERITQVSILSNSDNDKVPMMHVRFDMTEFDYSTLVSFVDIFIDNFKIKGIEGIHKINAINEEAVITFNNENGEMTKQKQHVIYTGGVNMKEIRYINGVDLNKTLCNDVMVIYETYGIDAARAALIKEFTNVFAAGGNKVNFPHLEILCDLMTNTGTPTSIDRHGMNKSETDPLARASFEKTVDQLIAAAVFGEIDHMNNVSSRICAGLVIKGGTGLCDVMLDTELLEKSEYTEDLQQKYIKTYNEVSTSSVMTDIMKKDMSGIFVPE